MTDKTIVSWFIANFPILVNEMKCADHNYDLDNVNPFHQEGDVWTHTMMVVRKAQEITDDTVVHWAALLHDIGKPSCLEYAHDTKRVRFFGHEGMSAFMALDVLDVAVADGMFNRADTEMVFVLIAGHTDLFGRNIESNKQLTRMGKSFGQDIDLFEALCDLATADSKGRLVDPNKVESQELDTLKMNAIRDGILSHPPARRTANDAPRLGILIGPPLSGKSTWRCTLGQQYEVRKNLDIISRDDTLMELYGQGKTYQEAWGAADQKVVDNNITQQFLCATRAERDIVVDMTNMSRKVRKKWLANTPQNYRKDAAVFMTSFQQLIERNRTRFLETGKDIPHGVICNMIRRYSDPGFDEFDNITYIPAFKDLK